MSVLQVKEGAYMKLPPDLEKRITDVLRQLKSQGPEDPAISFIAFAVNQKISHDKLQDFLHEGEED